MLIFLAGVEGGETIDIVKAGLIDNAFYSYYYMRTKKSPDTLLEGRKHIKQIIVDSGAHTFFSELEGQGLSVSVHKKKTKTKETPEEYFKKYLLWVKQYYHYFDYFVELDIGEIVGQEQVLAWRELFKKEGVYNKCITVYHPKIVTMEDWIKTIEDSESKYVAVEGDRRTRTRLPYLKLIKPAYDRGVKVHGFAMIKRNAIEKYPFYSVDSSSWKAGSQYGANLSHTSEGIKVMAFNKNPKDLYGLVGKVHGLTESLQTTSLQAQRLKRYEIAIMAYKEMERHYTELWRKRGITWPN